MQGTIINIIVFIIVFGIIVVVHEYGHLFFAKRAGILVREFAIGMGPKIFAHKGGDGTLYTIRILPLGGYVRMAGWGDDTTEIKKGTPAGLVFEDSKVVRINTSPDVELEGALPIYVTEYDFDHDLTITGETGGETRVFRVDHEATIIEEDGTEVRIAPEDVQYQSASLPGRMMTNFAGPLNNFILGLLAFIVLTFVQGGVPANTNQLGSVDKSLPAYAAGLRSGDKVVAIDGQSVKTWEDILNQVSKSKGRAVTFSIDRNGQAESLTISPKKQDGRYVIGVTQTLKTGFIDKLLGGFTQAVNSATMIFKALGSLIAQPNLNKLGGPVAIFQATGIAARGGFVTVLGFMAILSINLGIVNLIPIPALDGGKILLNIIEAIRRKPISQEREGLITMVGVIFMVVLMIAVTWNDIMRAFFR